jgi:hypothetical protein
MDLEEDFDQELIQERYFLLRDILYLGGNRAGSSTTSATTVQGSWRSIPSDRGWTIPARFSGTTHRNVAERVLALLRHIFANEEWEIKFSILETTRGSEHEKIYYVGNLMTNTLGYKILKSQ